VTRERSARVEAKAWRKLTHPSGEETAELPDKLATNYYAYSHLESSVVMAGLVAAIYVLPRGQQGVDGRHGGRP